MSNKEKVVQVTVKIKESHYESLKLLSAKSHKPMAEIIRMYILQGMSVEKSKDDIDFIRKNIREELRSVMDGYANRIIKLLIKIGTMTISMCFFTSKLLYILIAKHKDKIDYDTMLNDAKKKAAAFLGMQDQTVNDACNRILYDERE